MQNSLLSRLVHYYSPGHDMLEKTSRVNRAHNLVNQGNELAIHTHDLIFFLAWAPYIIAE